MRRRFGRPAAVLVGTVFLLSLMLGPASAGAPKPSPGPVLSDLNVPVGGHPPLQRGAKIVPQESADSCGHLDKVAARFPKKKGRGSFVCTKAITSPAELAKLAKKAEKLPVTPAHSGARSTVSPQSAGSVRSAQAAASADDVPSACYNVYNTPQYERTWACLAFGTTAVIYPSVDGVPVPGAAPIGLVVYDVAQYAHVTLKHDKGDYLYDGVGEDDGTEHQGEPTNTWTYSVRVRVVDVEEVVPGATEGMTVSVEPHYCQCQPPTLDWSDFTTAETQATIFQQPAFLGADVTGTWTHASTATNPGDIAFEAQDAEVIWTAPGTVNVVAEYDAPWLPRVRCDAMAQSEAGSPQVGPGCVYPEFRPVMKYAMTGQWATYPELALHIRDAQSGYGVPGMSNGSPSPPTYLTRISMTDPQYKKNRDTACPETGLPRPAGDSCDEYPMASTWEGADMGIGYSCRMIKDTQNSGGGAKLGWFYAKQHVMAKTVIDGVAFGDEFSVQVVGGQYSGTRTWSANAAKTCSYPVTPTPDSVARTGLDLSAANRRAPIAGVYDWSKAGYRQGGNLPSSSDFSAAVTCTITPAALASSYGVIPDDGTDDTAGIQQAIDAIKTNCSPSAGYSTLSLIQLPAGEISVSREIYVDADYLVLRGAGSDPATGTKIVFTPDANTRYDQLTDDGTNWDKDKMTSGAASGGWIWPGRGVFRVQTRAVNDDYDDDYKDAPANRKDLFEGTVNVHWKAGAKLRGKPGDTGFAARTGDTKIYIDNATNSKIRANLTVGTYVNIRAANTMNFYRQMKAVPTDYPLQNLTMRQQIFQITGVGTTSTDRWITIDKPLEYDVPVTSISDGSEPIPCDDVSNGGPCPTDPTPSKASPLVDPVVGVGIENLYLTQPGTGVSPTTAVHNYGNMDPATAINGIVLKWAVNDWVRGVRTYMTGSHPIVTEEAKNLTIINNSLDGAWNKGKGGNGYFRGSRVWDSIYAGNTTRNLRHFTFQWSASGNVAIGNDVDSDLNLHGGWERNNLLELNTVTVPYEHRSASCFNNCGDEGNSGPDDSTWFPIWWAAGAKAVKWSGSSGPNNVFFDNTMTKQTTYGGAYTDYYPNHQTIYRFGWNAGFQHLQIGGIPISDWSHNEQVDYTGGNGVDASAADTSPSLFLNQIPTS